MSDPCTSEERIDDIDQEVHKQSGWFKAAAGFAGIAIMALGSFNGIILSKLTNIETLISDYRVVQMQQSEQIKTLQFRIDKIEQFQERLHER